MNRGVIRDRLWLEEGGSRSWGRDTADHPAHVKVSARKGVSFGHLWSSPRGGSPWRRPARPASAGPGGPETNQGLETTPLSTKIPYDWDNHLLSNSGNETRWVNLWLEED